MRTRASSNACSSWSPIHASAHPAAPRMRSWLTVIGSTGRFGAPYENCKSLLDQLDGEQTAKAHAMQRAWIAYRDTTCGSYDDTIRGLMSNMMHSACNTRETARRAILLSFLSGL